MYELTMSCVDKKARTESFESHRVNVSRAAWTFDCKLHTFDTFENSWRKGPGEFPKPAHLIILLTKGIGVVPVCTRSPKGITEIMCPQLPGLNFSLNLHPSSEVTPAVSSIASGEQEIDKVRCLVCLLSSSRCVKKSPQQTARAIVLSYITLMDGE